MSSVMRMNKEAQGTPHARFCASLVGPVGLNKTLFDRGCKLQRLKSPNAGKHATKTWQDTFFEGRGISKYIFSLSNNTIKLTKITHTHILPTLTKCFKSSLPIVTRIISYSFQNTRGTNFLSETKKYFFQTFINSSDIRRQNKISWKDDGKKAWFISTHQNGGIFIIIIKQVGRYEIRLLHVIIYVNSTQSQR